MKEFSLTKVWCWWLASFDGADTEDLQKKKKKKKKKLHFIFLQNYFWVPADADFICSLDELDLTNKHFDTNLNKLEQYNCFSYVLWYIKRCGVFNIKFCLYMEI